LTTSILEYLEADMADSTPGDESDLIDLEPRARLPTPDDVKTQKQQATPNQASGSESRTQYRSRAIYVSPVQEENNLRSYLTNRNLTKSNTEDNSLDRSFARKKSKEMILQPRWSAIKQHASTSRISTCPRFERNEPIASDRSHNVYRKYIPHERRSIHKSMNYRENELYQNSLNLCEKASTGATQNNRYYLRENAPEEKYKIDYNLKYTGRAKFGGSKPESGSRNIYRSTEGFYRQYSSRKRY
jgi:hypothetical protein